MTRFRFSVIDASGQRRRGELDASGQDQAKALLASNGDLVIEIEEAKKRHFFRLERPETVTPALAAEFALELSGLLSAGADLRHALDIQADGRGPVARLARTVRQEIDQGRALSTALKSTGGSADILSEFAAAAEAGAGLDTLLASAGQFLSTRSQALKKIKSALAYPLFISILALVALIIITVYVSPALAPLMEESGSDGVIVTLGSIGETIQDNQQLILLILAVITVGLFFGLRSNSAQQGLNRFVWRLPIVGSVARDLDTGQSCAVMAALIESGRPLETALDFAGAVSGPELASSYRKISERIRDGDTASNAFAKHPELPLEVRRLAMLGEQSSTFGQAIKQAGQLCHERALRRIDKVSAIIGPALVIGLGVSVSLLMISVLNSLSSIGDPGL